MKKHLFLTALFAIALSGFSSCKDEEKKEYSIVGSWEMHIVENLNAQGAVIDTETCTSMCFVFTFNANGTCLVARGSASVSGTYTYKDGVINMSWSDELDDEFYKFTVRNVTDDTLTVHIYEDATKTVPVGRVTFKKVS
jgi:hypothetical protein